MKITIQRSILLERLSQVSKAVSAKESMPILTGILVDSRADSLRLVGSDTRFSISTVIEDGFEKKEPGAVVLPAKQLLEVVRKMPEKPIDIEVGDGFSTRIKCGSSRVMLPGMDPDVYPEVDGELQEQFTLDGPEFQRMISSTAFAVSKNETTPILQGINFKITGGTLTVTATDRHRLSRYISTVEDGLATEAVVATKPLEAVAQLNTDTVKVGFSKNKAYFQAGEYTYTAWLMEGNYPDTSRIISTTAVITAKVDRDQLLHALDLARITTDNTKVVKLHISEGEIIVSSQGEGGSGMEEVLEADVDGEELKLAANVEYLISAVKSIRSDRVELLFSGAMLPIIIQGVGDEKCLFLVLPVRMRGE